MKKIKWYISGKVSGDPNYRQKFKKAEEKLKAEGYEVCNPVEGEEEGHEWTYYLKKDIKKLMDCTGIYFLSDWVYSKGAQLEFRVAMALDYPHRFETEENK